MSGASPRKNINRHMTTTNQTQPPPRIDWTTYNLSDAHLDELQRLFDIETKYRYTAALGTALLGYLARNDHSREFTEQLELAWTELILFDTY